MQSSLSDEKSESNPVQRTSKKTKRATMAAPNPALEERDNGVECDEEDEPSEIDSFILDENESEDEKSSNSDEDDAEDEDDDSVDPEYLLDEGEDDEEEEEEEADGAGGYQVDPVTQARLEALFETAGIGKITGESKQLTDPEVLKRLTSSVSCALDEAAAALTRMKSEPPTDGRSLVEAYNEGDISKVRRLLDEGRVSVHDTTEEGESLLSLACTAGYYELAQVLLAMRANVEDRGMKGDNTPLMEAASAGHVEIVKLLIDHHADVNAQSQSGNTPLMYACVGGHEEVVRILLEAGSHVEDHNENGHTPLMEAASGGHVGVAKILLQHGAGINTHSNEFKESALTLACYKGHLEMVRFLLDAGADQEHKTDEMHTALMEASMDGHVEVARLLLDSGAQVNMPADSFESPLTLAACGGHVELAMLLLERGANIEEVNDEGYTPLMEAAREGHEEMVALLLSQGADINAQTEETQETALTLACCGGFLEVADFLIKAGADLELGASTPLMEAAQEGHLELVKYLLENGALVNAETGTGDTALTYACENGHTDVADLLLQYDAKLEHESEGGRTPLMKAARAGHLCTVQFLISKGADVNKSTTNNDHTPLSLACAGGHLTVVELLLKHGADPYHKLKDNSTMLIEAAKGGHTGVVGLLLDYPSSIVMATPPAPHPPHPQQLNLEYQQHDVLPAQLGGGSPSIRTSQATVSSLKQRKTQRPPGVGTVKPIPLESAKAAKTAALAGSVLSEPAGFDFIEGSGFVIEGLEDKGLDAKSYIQSMLRRTEGSSREEQIIQKEQILAELQRVERELQEKAQAQFMLSSSAGQKHQEQFDNESKTSVQNENVQNNLNVSFEQQMLHAIRPAPSSTASTTTSTASHPLPASLISRAPNLANLPPSERPKAKPSRKINFSDPAKSVAGAVSGQVGMTSSKKLQLQASLQQHNQQLAQLQQLQQLNQQLQQQVFQQRQLKQQNQATLAALQQNAIANQNQLAALQHNVAQLQQLEQQILSQQQTPTSVSSSNNGQQHAQLQHRVQQILHQKQQLQHQIKQFQLQVEQQLAYTQHATCSAPSVSGGDTPPVTAETTTMKTTTRNKRSKDEANMTSSQYEFVQASQALKAVEALNLDPGIDHSDQDVDSHIVVQNFQTPLDASCQAILNGYKDGLQVGPNLATTLQIQYPGVSSDGSQASSQPFGHPLLLQGPHFPSLDNSGQITFTTEELGGTYLHNNEAIFLPAGQTPTSLAGGAPPDMAKAHQHTQAEPQPLAKPAGGKKLKQSSAKKKDVCDDHLQDPGEKRTDWFPNIDIEGSSPQCLSLTEGYPASVDLNSETESNHDTALTLACAGGHEELVKLLLERGADIEHRDKKGFTPLILAATAGHEKVVELLLDHKADIEAQSERTKDTPLSLACSGGRYEVVEVLLRRSANKEHRNVSDYTPLSLAASGGYVNIISLLLKHGAEINSRTGSKLGISPLMLAAMNGHTAAVKLLLDHGSDINAQIETNRNTALTLACFQGRHEVVSLLLDRKANVEHRAKTGLTPLMEAASGGYVDVGRVLLDKGADVNAPPVPSSRDTALTIAADKGHYRFVELLLSRGAQVDVRNKKGNSSLWLAANGGHLEVVQLLYSAGADIDSQDNRKVSCLMAAFRKGHTKVVKWMVKHVTQFPSDQETARYIQTQSSSGDNKELLKKCHQCMEIIRIAKDRQAAEAAKNASSLLEELDREKNLEESKKAAAARKREKKKRKKLERQMKATGQGKDEDTKEDDFEKENRHDDEEEEEEAANNHDSGIDANSQGSMEHHEKTILPPTTASTVDASTTSTATQNSKKNKKNRNKKESGLKEKIENETVVEEVISKPVDSVTSSPASAACVSPPNQRTALKGRTNRRGLEEKSEVSSSPKKGGNASQISGRLPNNASSSTSGRNQQPAVGETGWKEVVRKSKKVSVPAHAISRVIGRGGCNINAIRELSGAHIEVEKQGQKSGSERSISIKGSAEATRQAHAWIQAVISNPEKDIADIVGRQKYKVLHQQQPTLVISNSSSKSLITPVTTTAVGKAAAKVTQQTSKSVAVTTTKKTTTASSSTKPSASGIPAFTSAKPSSFAAVASGSVQNSDNLGMIQTGTHPGSLKSNSNKRPASTNECKDFQQSISSGRTILPQQPQPFGNHQEKKMEFSPFAAQPSPVEPPTSVSNLGGNFSPFKTLDVKWVGISDEQKSKNFAKVTASHLPTSGNPLPPNSMVMDEVEDRSVSPGLPDMSKAPGYRAVGAGRLGSPHSGSSWITTDNLFQERCNSAPGTPISPVVAPIGPPPPPLPLPPQQTSISSSLSSKMSPGSEPEQEIFRPMFSPGNISSSLPRSMTPDSMADHTSKEFRRNPGGGKPGKHSAALDSAAISPEHLLETAAQIASAAGTFSDFTPPRASANFDTLTDLIQSNSTRYPTTISTGRLLTSFSQAGMPQVSKPPPSSTVSAASMKLNPNAPDFMRMQAPPSVAFARAPPARIPPPDKCFPQFDQRFNFQVLPPPSVGLQANVSGFHNFAANQPYLNPPQQQQPSLDMSGMDFCGKSVLQISQMLGNPLPPSANASAPISGLVEGVDTGSKFSTSRPIGSERYSSYRAPLPSTTSGFTAPKGLWDLGSRNIMFDNLGSEIHSTSMFTTLSTGLSGSGFEGFGKSAFNGGTEAATTPIKSEFSPSVSGSAGKKTSNAYIDLSAAGDTSVRRNMNRIWDPSPEWEQ